METNYVKCIHCGGDVDVSTLLADKIKEQFRLDYNSKVSELNNQFDKKSADVKKMREELTTQQKQFDESLDKALSEKLKSEKANLEKQLRKQIEEEKSDQIKSYQEQLQQKTIETKELKSKPNIYKN